MKKPVLYYFFATWCGPCRIQSPIIDALAEKIGDKVDVKKEWRKNRRNIFRGNAISLTRITP